MKSKNMRFILVVAAAVMQMALIGWIRFDFQDTEKNGIAYETPASVDFTGNFYDRNYINVNIPIDHAPWLDAAPPEKGSCIYVSVGKDAKGKLYVKWAGASKPADDYICTHAESFFNGTVYFHFPFRRYYISSEDMKKLPISELSERVRVRDPASGKWETKTKNEVTARFRIKDGDAVITDILVNGLPVTESFNTLGTNIHMTYAASGQDEDRETT